MTKQEMLYELYNDALFRLLMHSVAQHQGQQYQEENQALKAQEGGPSETAKRRCLRTISRQVRRGHARAAARTASRVLSKAAVVMLLVISCLTAAFAVSPVFRISTQVLQKLRCQLWSILGLHEGSPSFVFCCYSFCGVNRL